MVVGRRRRDGKFPGGATAAWQAVRMDLGDSPVRALSAVTLVTADMARAVATYQRLGFAVVFGGPQEAFTTLQAGAGFVNLQRLEPGASVPSGWGRIVLHVDDVDAMYRRAVAAGLTPLMAPADAPWGERYFHVRDADGHELSFARPILR